MDLTPILLSLKTAAASTFITFFLGVYAAWKTANIKYGKGLLDAVFTLPMVLPPTVIGFFLLVFFGKNTWIGNWMAENGHGIIFTWKGAVIAAIVVSFPLMYRTTRSAFEQLNPNLKFLPWSCHGILATYRFLFAV